MSDSPLILPLTGLRGFALVLVVLSGLAASEVLPAEFGTGLDQIGLMVFVAVTGFLIALHHANTPCDRYSAVDFLAGRARRTLAAYLAVVLFSIAITRWLADWPYPIGSVGDAARAVLLVDAPGALWIVPVMAQLSLLFVAAWWARSRGWHPIVVAALAVAATLPAVLGWGPQSGQFLSVAAPAFFIGVAMGMLWLHDLEPLLARYGPQVSVAGALLFVLVCMNLPAVRQAHGWVFGSSVVSATWLDPLSLLLVEGLVMATAAGASSLAVLRTGPLTAVGRFSFALYLVVPVMIAVLPL